MLVWWCYFEWLCTIPEHNSIASYIDNKSPHDHNNRLDRLDPGKSSNIIARAPIKFDRRFNGGIGALFPRDRAASG